MTFQVSPGVNVSEIDLTTVIPAVATSTGAVAGPFEWGPVNVVRQVSNENELVQIYGKPKTASAPTFYTGANFLAYANDLRVVRAANTATYTAVSNVQSANAATLDSVQVKNEEDYETNHATLTNTCFVARYPGAVGNSLQVSVFANTNTSFFTSWEHSSLFDRKPGTSFFAAQFEANANDELHIVVVDKNGAFSGVPGTILERFEALSKASNAKDESGQSIYYKDVLLRSSKYIFATNPPEPLDGVNNTWGLEADIGVIFEEMNGASNDVMQFNFFNGATVAVNEADLITAYDYFEDVESIDISLLMASGHSDVAVSQRVIEIAEARKDCLAFVSPPLSTVQTTDPTTAVIEWRNDTLNKSTSYAVMDSGWKYQYDKYNDVYRWVPLNGDIAGLCARTDSDRDPWFSPAGLVRGQIKNIIKLAYNPKKAQRDELYKNGINPIVSFPGEGTLLFGDKTLLGRPSAFDRINVRRLFIVLEKSVAKAARSSLFEFNDEFTRAQFVNLVEPFLRTVQGRRGIYDYRVVCDETNNTPEIIDRNEFVGDIYVKPAKSINFIQLNFVAVRTGVSFEEIVGKF